MLVTFVESGYITFEEVGCPFPEYISNMSRSLQSIGALLGVNIGTTITVYLVSFKITK